MWVPGAVDAVLHFASPASPVDYLEMPIQTLKVGSLGTHNCLGLAKAKGARFLLASTSEVYGDPQVHPQPETYWGHVNPVGPRGVYDEAKRFAEAMTMAYHRYHGLDVRIVRIFNTYGPRMRADDGRVVSNFLVQALQGKPLTIYGDGDADPQLLLRRRRGAGHPRPARRRHDRARSTSATPASSPSLELAELVHRGDRVDVGDRLRAAAGRRPDPAPARHHPRPRRRWAGSPRSSCARASSAPPTGSAARCAEPSASARRRGRRLSGRGPRPRRGGRGTSRPCGAGPRRTAPRPRTRTARRPGWGRRGGGAGRRAWTCPSGSRP